MSYPGQIMISNNNAEQLGSRHSPPHRVSFGGITYSDPDPNRNPPLPSFDAKRNSAQFDARPTPAPRHTAISVQQLFLLRGPPSGPPKSGEVICQENATIFIKLALLAVVNIVMFTVPLIDEARAHLRKKPIWLVALFALFQITLWLVEVNMMYVVTSKKQKLFWTCLINIIYAYTLGYTALLLYVHYNPFLIGGGVVSLSVMYFAYHVYSVEKELQAALQEQPSSSIRGVPHNVTYFNTTRPQTKDNQLGVGPPLVFPIPEEFSTPGVGNDRKTSSDRKA